MGEGGGGGGGGGEEGGGGGGGGRGRGGERERELVMISRCAGLHAGVCHLLIHNGSQKEKEREKFES